MAVTALRPPEKSLAKIWANKIGSGYFGSIFNNKRTPQKR